MFTKLLTRPIETAFRITVIGQLLAWSKNIQYSYSLYLYALQHPISDNYFPSFFQSGSVFVILFFLPMVTALAAFSLPSRALMMSHAIVTIGCSLGLLWHQIAFHSQGMNIAFWCGLWLFWLASHHGTTPERKDLERLSLAVQLLVSLIFLGGFLGKLTSGYWDGSVFRELNLPRSTAMGGLLYSYFDRSFVQLLASRIGIIGEGIMACLIFIPSRFAFGLAISIVGGMIFIMGSAILDATGTLLGAVTAGWFLFLASCRLPETSGQQAS